MGGVPHSSRHPTHASDTQVACMTTPLIAGRATTPSSVNSRVGILRQSLRFLASGGVAASIGLSTFAFLQVMWPTQVPYMAAWLISTVISLTVGFILQRRFVFNVRGQISLDFIRFVAVSATSLAFNAVALPLLVSYLGANPLGSQIAITGAVALYNFVAHRTFSFARTMDHATSSAGITDD